MTGLDTPFIGILVIAALAWAWHAGLRVRERATAVAMQTCSRADLQFLEGTVALRGMRPCRDGAGRVTWRRSYVFDYSDDGVSRRRGFVVFTGNRLECVGLEQEAPRD